MIPNLGRFHSFGDALLSGDIPINPTAPFDIQISHTIYRVLPRTRSVCYVKTFGDARLTLEQREGRAYVASFLRAHAFQGARVAEEAAVPQSTEASPRMVLSYPSAAIFQQCWCLHPGTFRGQECLLTIAGQPFLVADEQTTVTPLAIDPVTRRPLEKALSEDEWTPAIRETLGVIAQALVDIRQKEPPQPINSEAFEAALQGVRNNITDPYAAL